MTPKAKQISDRAKRAATSIIAVLDAAAIVDHRLDLDRVPHHLHRQLCDLGLLELIADVRHGEPDWQTASGELLTAMMAYYRARALAESLDRAWHFAYASSDEIRESIRSASAYADSSREAAAARIRAIFTILD